MFQLIFRHVFEKSAMLFWMKNYLFTALIIGSLLGLSYLLRPVGNEMMAILINGLISIGVSVVFCV